MRTVDVARTLVGPPTDSLPSDPGPPWRTIAEIGALPEYDQGLPAITTGYSALDGVLGGGFRIESTYILAGRTGTSKSTLALNIARRVAASQYRVLVLKLEESATEAVYRLHSAAAQVPFLTLLNGANRADVDIEAKLEDGWGFIQSLPIFFSDVRSLDGIERIAERHSKNDGKLIILDQLSMVDVVGHETAYERATVISNRLRILARELRIPILIVSQVNREAAKKKRETISANDLRDSGAIENDASAVIIIDRVRKPFGSKYRGSDLARYLQIVVPKNRYGPVIEEIPIELLWWPRICRIEDAAEEHLEDGQ